MKNFIVLYLLLTMSMAQGYRFTCNSIDANGNVESDKCGIPCDAERAARWVPPDIEVRIDLKVLPPGIDANTWKEIALSSLESWNNIPGISYKIRHGGSDVQRNFGSDSSAREIFWVTDPDEWRSKVGAGEKGTLGVTLSPYFCPRTHPHRELFDADLMMNASEDFIWKNSCEDRNCQSIRSTFTHELGHVAGLGHPCTLCSNSVMTAKAGFLIEYPMFDDQEGLRALYPGVLSGGLGSRCDQSAECKTGYECISQEEARYCSQPCSLEYPCPSGYVCNEYMCQFASGRLGGVVGIGESCTAKFCAEKLICAGSDKTHLYCYAGCIKSGECKAGETCVPLEKEPTQGACIVIGTLGDSCHWKNPCSDNLICVLDNDKGTCLVPCVLGQKNVCKQDEICRDLGQGAGACWKEGGVRPVAPTTGDSGTFCMSAPRTGSSHYRQIDCFLALAIVLLAIRRLSHSRQ